MAAADPNKKPPPIDDEMVVYEGVKIKVSDLTEAQAKDIIRSIVREQRMVSEAIMAMFGGLGPRGMFPADDDVANSVVMPPPDKMQ